MSARDDAATYAVILEADHAASVAHDFIYGLNDVTQEQASAAIWTIHNALRPLIVLEGDDVAGNLEGDLKDKLANEDAVALRNYLASRDRTASATSDGPQAVATEIDRLRAERDEARAERDAADARWEIARVQIQHQRYEIGAVEDVLAEARAERDEARAGREGWRKTAEALRGVKPLADALARAEYAEAALAEARAETARLRQAANYVIDCWADGDDDSTADAIERLRAAALAGLDVALQNVDDMDDAIHLCAPWEPRKSLCGQWNRMNLQPRSHGRPDAMSGCWGCLQADDWITAALNEPRPHNHQTRDHTGSQASSEARQTQEGNG